MTKRLHFDDDLPIDPDLASDDPAEPTIGSREGRPTAGPRRVNPGVLAAIAAGGSLGTLARAALGVAFPTRSGFPWTTFTINAVGSFLLGVAVVLLVDRFRTPRNLRPFIATGFLGGFTTFSTFMVESDQLGQHDHVLLAATYLVSSIVVGVVAAWLGIVGGRRFIFATVPDRTIR